MRLLHEATKTHARFDDPTLVSHAGLVPAARLMENVGLEQLVGEHLRVRAKVGANPGLKVGSLVAGMVAGADDIDGMDLLLRHGALPDTVAGIRAPSTLGSFLRAFDHRNVAQLAAVHRRLLARLADEPNAVWDDQAGGWISDAEIARVPYTAFAASRAHRHEATLIVRRVRRLNPQATAQGQHEPFATYRYHAVFTDSPFELVQTESQHRGHAVIEQINADLIDGPLAHLPSGDFAANAAWLQLAATAHTLTRALGTLASARHAKARGATIRRELLAVAPPRPQRTRHHHLAPTPALALARRLARPLRRHPPPPPPRPPPAASHRPGLALAA